MTWSGEVRSFGNAPYLVDKPGLSHARSLSVCSLNNPGWWVMDGYGQYWNRGSAPPAPSGAPYWPGCDIARSSWVLGNLGYTLDGYGGVHNFGNAPPLSGYPYWSGWDIARGLWIHL